jgi:hypothetical protein
MPALPVMHTVPTTLSHKPDSSVVEFFDRVLNVDAQSPNVPAVLCAIGVQRR